MGIPYIQPVALPGEIEDACNNLVSYFFMDNPSINLEFANFIREYLLISVTLTLKQKLGNDLLKLGNVLSVCMKRIYSDDYEPVFYLGGFIDGFYENNEKPLTQEIGSLFIGEQTSLLVAESMIQLGYLQEH